MWTGACASPMTPGVIRSRRGFALALTVAWIVLPIWEVAGSGRWRSGKLGGQLCFDCRRFGRPDRMALGQQARARADGLPAVLLVGNWSQTINDFSERLAHQTLRSPTTVASAASALARDALDEGWNGSVIPLGC